MFAKRLILTLAALAVILPFATGCRANRCCKSSTISAAPPCCPGGPGLPPPSVLPPSQF